MLKRSIKKIFFIIILGIFISTPVNALNMTSTNFIINDPVIGTFGGYGTSTNFQLISSGDSLLIGSGSSATYIGHYGFLYYPFVNTTPTITFSVSDSSLQFGALSPSGARYATTSGGSGSSTVAHTIDASSNATNGYTLTYYGDTLKSGSNSVTPATISGDIDGSPGSSQFAIAVSTNGGATIPSAYDQTSNNWKFLANTTETIASTTGATSTETFSVRYLSNISPTTAAGQYSTSITYVLTGNF
jgi:hypothetical protein